MSFANRTDAGQRLAAALASYVDRDVVVVGLPRGGVPVAFEVARALGAPLDVIVVRKLGVPFRPELGMGAVGEGDARVINADVVRMARISGQEVAEIERRERDVVDRLARCFRGNLAPVPLAGRIVIIVDDGVATGSTARAACQVARAHGAAEVVLAVPVGPPGVEQQLRPDADSVICLSAPSKFHAVGQVYADFAQISDEQVNDLLGHAAERQGAPRGTRP